MRYLFRLLLAVSSMSLMGMIYLVNSGKTFFSLSPWACAAGYFLAAVVLAKLPLLFVGYLDRDTIGEVSTQKPAEATFVPIYLGYFFIALSVTDLKVFAFVTLLLLLFIWYSQHLYFNILWIIFGYRYYEIMHGEKQYLIITKRKDWKESSGTLVLYRINNYTFIEAEGA